MILLFGSLAKRFQVAEPQMSSIVSMYDVMHGHQKVLRNGFNPNVHEPTTDCRHTDVEP